MDGRAVGQVNALVGKPVNRLQSTIPIINHELLVPNNPLIPSCLQKTLNIPKDSFHPSHRWFELCPLENVGLSKKKKRRTSYLQFASHGNHHSKHGT